MLFSLVCLAAFLLHNVYYAIVPVNNGNCHPAYLPAFVAIVGVFPVMLWLSAKLRAVGWLSAIGRQSLGIMLLHAPMCHTAAASLNRLFIKGSTVWCLCFLVAYVAIVALSYWLTILIRKHTPVLFGMFGMVR